MLVRRSSFQPAALRNPLIDSRFCLFCCSIFKAACLMIPIFCGALPLRILEASSLKLTSKIQCNEWWVDPRNFPASPSQNGAGASQLTPLPLGERTLHSWAPMRKQVWLLFCYSFYKKRSSCFVPLKWLVFPHCPCNQCFVEVSPHRIHCWPSISPIVI